MRFSAPPLLPVMPAGENLFPRMRIHVRTLMLSLSVAATLCCASPTFGADPVLPSQGAEHPRLVTTVAQFGILSGADYVVGCNFRLNGVITLVDTNRNLVVLQDATGAVALNFALRDFSLKVGQLVTLEGDDCRPYF